MLHQLIDQVMVILINVKFIRESITFIKTIDQFYKCTSSEKWQWNRHQINIDSMTYILVNWLDYFLNVKSFLGDITYIKLID